jgi:hypothetical protein
MREAMILKKRSDNDSRIAVSNGCLSLLIEWTNMVLPFVDFSQTFCEKQQIFSRGHLILQATFEEKFTKYNPKNQTVFLKILSLTFTL